MSKKREVDINFNVNIHVTGSNKIGTNISTHLDIGKAETDMSVAQLAYFCRIFYDLGYFINKNQTEMLKVAAHNFITTNANEISLKSLKAKYYSADQNTKESVKKEC